MLALTRAYTPWIHLAAAHPRGPWAVEQRTLAHYLLVVSYEGAEDLVVQGKHYDIPEGGSYLIQPGMLAERIGSKKGNRPGYAHFDLIFNEHRNEHGNTLGFNPDLKGREHLLQPVAKEVWGVDLPVIVPKALQPMIFNAMDPIVRRWESGYPHDHLVANQELTAFLHAWILYESPKTIPDTWLGPEARVRRAEAAARAKLSHAFGVEDFAKAAGIERAQLARIYRQLRGMSPGKALREMRLAESERLLVTTTLSVQRIGQEVGYPNPTVFARCFRQRHGVAPQEWRARMLSHQQANGDAELTPSSDDEISPLP